MPVEHQQPSFPGFEAIPRVPVEPPLRRSRSPYHTEDPLRALCHSRISLPLQQAAHLELVGLQEEHGFSLDEIGASTLALFFQPRPDGTFPTQKEISMAAGQTYNPRRIKAKITHEVELVERRVMVGPRAIEALGLPASLYGILRRQGFETVDQITEVDERTLARLSGNRVWFDILLDKMHRMFPDWNPQVVFRDELPPEEAFSY